MSTMLKHWIITGFCGFCLILTGCGQHRWMYSVDVQQGNIITPKMQRQLRVGMMRDDVERVMGTPVLVDTFNNNRYNYVYEHRPSKGCMRKRCVTVYFSNNRVVRIS